MRAMTISVLGILLLSATPSVAGVDRWVPIGPPGGVHQVVPSPTHAQGLYAVTNGGVYWSPNASLRWYELESTVRPTQNPIRQVTIEPLNGQDVPYAIFEDYGSIRGAGLFRYGTNHEWTRIGELRFQNVSSFSVGTGDPAPFYLTAQRAGVHSSGVFRSRDRGETWKRILPGSARIVPDPVSPNTLYAVSLTGGILRSDDDGSTWQHVDRLSDGSRITNIVNFNVSAEHPERLAALTYFRLYTSDNRGEAWQAAARFPVGFCGEGGLALVPNGPAQETIYVRCQEGAYASTDGGATWQEPGTGLPAADSQTQLVVDPRNSQELYAASHEGVYRSRDGGSSWVRASKGIKGSGYRFVFAPSEPDTAYTTNYVKVLTSDDHGRSWRKLKPDFGAEEITSLTVDPTDAQLLYLGTYASRFYRSLNGGLAWEFLSRLFVDTLFIDPRDPQVLVAGGFGLHRSTDGGRTWTETFPGRQGNISNYFDRLQAAPGNPDIIFATGDSEIVGSSDRIFYRSTDGGLTWKSVPGFDNLSITPDEPPVLYKLGFPTVLRSFDLGDTWDYPGFPGSYPFLALSEPPTLYVFGTDSVLRSRDAGSTWQPIQAWNRDLVSKSAELAAHPKRPDRLFAYNSQGVLAATFVDAPPALLGPMARFEARVAWYTTDGRSGPGRVIPLGPNAAAFWFQGQPLPDLAIKLLPSGDGFYRVFQAGLSHLEHDLTIVDHVTGTTYDTSKRFGTVRSSVDPQAFPPPISQVPSDLAAGVADTFTEPAPSTGPNTDLPLLGGRFTASIQWRRPNGSSGQGQAVALQDGAGWFWFFSDDNPEVILKMIDGRAHNGHFWVYTGALTNLEYTLTVTDQESGTVRRYFAAQGEVQSIVDTSAFAGS